MDKITKFQSIIKSVFQRYHRDEQPEGYQEYETQMVTDDANGHYYLMDIGWHDMQRIHGCLLHVDIKNGKIWIQQDWTEEGIADELIAAGVSTADIVLAFQAPYKRPHTGFATA
jgi:hypothetical protein